MKKQIKQGVYQIKNLINGKLYIGSTSTDNGFDQRWYQHCYLLNRNRHPNCYLQRAWNKYRANFFVFEILEKCQPQDCIVREQYYLDTLLFADCNDSRFKSLGYNILRVAHSFLGYRHTNKTKAKISKSVRGRKLSKEHKAKIGAAHQGMIRSRKAKANMSVNHANVSGENNPNAKLTYQDANEIRQLTDMTLHKIAERYGVGTSTIHDIRKGRRWQ